MIELNKIYCENCLETMKRMPDEFVDLTVTSPPYDDMDENFNPIPRNGMRTYNGYSWDFKAIAQELFRVTKTGGVVVWIVNDPTIDGSESLASSFQKIYFRRIGFNIYDTMIYEKNSPAYPSQDKYYQVFEYAFVISKDKPKTINLINDRKNRWYGEKWSNVRSRRNKDGELHETRWTGNLGDESGVRFNIWRINNGSGYSTKDEIAYQHPATFPEVLARDHVYSWSNENDLVYDPFGGSGTTAKMAILLKRNWIMSEISKEYCEISEKRLDPYLRQTVLEL